MKKSEFIWILVRLSGLVALACALYNFVLAVWSYIAVVSFSGPRNPSESGMISTAIVLILVKALSFAVLSLYLLKGGRLIFDLLNREGETKSYDE